MAEEVKQEQEKVQTTKVYKVNLGPGEKVRITLGKSTYTITENSLRGWNWQDVFCQFGWHIGQWQKPYNLPMKQRPWGGVTDWSDTFIIKQRRECDHCGHVTERTVVHSDGRSS